MILVRIIPLHKLDGLQIHNLEQFGFTLVHRGNYMQIWVERAAHRD